MPQLGYEALHVTSDQKRATWHQWANSTVDLLTGPDRGA